MPETKYQKLPWDKQLALQWGKYDYPVRPGIELEIYERAVRHIKKSVINPRVLILGSTPEFRDLLIKYKITPFCCDINPEVYKALRLLMKRKDKEIFIESDWRKYRSKEKFDLVIGHDVFNMLPPRSTNILAQNIAKNLKPRGRFIHSVLLKTAAKPKINPAQGFVNYRSFPQVIKRKVSFFTAVYSHLIVYLCQQNLNYYTQNDVLMLVEELYKKGLVTSSEIKKLKDIIKPSNIHVYPEAKEEFEQTIKKHFVIKGINFFSSKLLHFQSWPVYELVKK